VVTNSNASRSPGRDPALAEGKRRPRSVDTTIPAFDLHDFLASAGLARRIKKYARAAGIFSQGDAATHVFYLQRGRVKISVTSRTGKEAVVAIVEAGHFFGEGCLADQPRRMAAASALTACTVLVVEKAAMIEMLQTHGTLADRFLAHMLARNIRMEQDIVDRLFNSSEKRLARALLLLARYGTKDQSLLLPKISQQTLADMVGTTRSRINFFMNKFRTLGFIDYDGHIKIHNSLVTVVLHV